MAIPVDANVGGEVDSTGRRSVNTVGNCVRMMVWSCLVVLMLVGCSTSDQQDRGDAAVITTTEGDALGLLQIGLVVERSATQDLTLRIEGVDLLMEGDGWVELDRSDAEVSFPRASAADAQPLVWRFIPVGTYRGLRLRLGGQHAVIEGDARVPLAIGRRDQHVVEYMDAITVASRTATRADLGLRLGALVRVSSELGYSAPIDPVRLRVETGTAANVPVPPWNAIGVIGAGGAYASLQGVEVQVPAGALAEPILFGAHWMATVGSAGSPRIELVPHGVRFRAPASLRLPYDIRP